MRTFILISSLVLYGGLALAEPLKSQREQNLFEILDRMEHLQREIQQLRGLVEEQSYKIKILETGQQRLRQDFDQRLQAPTIAPVDEDTSEPELFEPAANEEPIAIAETIDNDNPVTSVEPEPGKVIESVLVSPEQQQAIEPLVATPRPSPRPTYRRPIMDEKQAYQRAYEMLRTGGTIQSIELFKQFLQDYPRGEYADNANYWLAEAYKLDQQIGLARLTFQNLITKFTNSPKVPDAKLKLAFIEAEMKNFAQARELLKGIIARYPGTSVAFLASKKLSEINAY